MMIMLVMAGLLARDARLRKTTLFAAEPFHHLSQKHNANKNMN
jgi:hypothetical protein